METAVKVILSLFLILGCRPIEDQQTTSNTNRSKSSSYQDLYVRYFFNAEATYKDIVFQDASLWVKYFPDEESKCANWFAQYPCWTEKNLVTKETSLAPEDVKELIELIRDTNFMSLEDVYGGAASGQRFYAQTLIVKLGEKEKKVVYQSFPGSAQTPDAFKSVREKVVELVSRKLGL